MKFAYIFNFILNFHSFRPIVPLCHCEGRQARGNLLLYGQEIPTSLRSSE